MEVLKMLLKQLRYDLEFSRFAFLLLGGILVSLAVLARVTAFMFSSSYGIRASVVAVIGVGVTIGVVVVQINKFFHSSLFGRFGYLALTLPITRGQLILSKLLAVGIWFNFFMAVNAVIVLVLAGGHSLLNTGRLAVYFTTYVHSAAVVFSLASVFLLNATLAHSTFGKMRVPGIVNTVATLVLILGYIYAIGWFTL